MSILVLPVSHMLNGKLRIHGIDIETLSEASFLSGLSIDVDECFQLIYEMESRDPRPFFDNNYRSKMLGMFTEINFHIEESLLMIGEDPRIFRSIGSDRGVIFLINNR